MHSIKTVRKEKYCGVCGDLAKTYHFGGLSCDSCKSFFRRSVQTENYRSFYCFQQNKCAITRANRKRCRSCRMSRCLAIGMNKKWVRTEEENQRSLKARAEKKICQRLFAIAFSAIKIQPSNMLKSGSSYKKTSEYELQLEKMTTYLSTRQMTDIESLIAKFSNMNINVPYDEQLKNNRNRSRTGDQVKKVLGTVCRRFSFYANLITEFTNLDIEDKTILLKKGMLEMAILRGSMVFDPVKKCWPSPKLPMYRETGPLLYLDDVARLTPENVSKKHVEFINFIQEMEFDEPVIILLILIVLFNPERLNLKKADFIEKTQFYYTTLLEDYVKWRYDANRSQMFGKLLTKLCDLRELSDSYDFYLKLDCAGDNIWTEQLEPHSDSLACCRPSFDCILNAPSEGIVSNPDQSLEESKKLDRPTSNSNGISTNLHNYYVSDSRNHDPSKKLFSKNNQNPSAIGYVKSTPAIEVSKHSFHLALDFGFREGNEAYQVYNEISTDNDIQRLNRPNDIYRPVTEKKIMEEISTSHPEEDCVSFLPLDKSKQINDDVFQLDENLTETSLVVENNEFFQILEEFLQL